MVYCSLDDLKARVTEQTLIQLTDDDGLGVINPLKIDRAIDRAGQEIDAWCGSRYAVPFAPAPAILVALAAELAIYYLHGRTQDEISESWRDTYRNAQALLKAIADGKVNLGEAPAAQGVASGGPKATAPGRIMTRERLEGF